jgi:hypothetical protein
MAKFVLKTPVVTINAVDLSDHVSEAVIETVRDEVEVTAFGAANKEILAGLGDATITLQVFQDFAAAEVDATLWPLSTTDTPFTVAIKPTNGAISATNPEYQLSVLMFTYSPINGAVGAASTTEVVFRNASQTGLVRDVTP